MEKKDCGKLMEKVFANVYNLMIPSSLDQNEPSTKLLSIMLPGITIDENMNPDDYEGSLIINQIVDRIPAISKNYVDSGRKVSLEYQKILSAVTPEDDPNAKDLREEYEAAQASLFSDGEFTPKYKKYLDFQKEYQQAQNEYLTECNKSKPDKKIVRTLQNKAFTALQNWKAAGRAEVDNALAIMERYRAFSPSSIFGNAILEYEMNHTETGMNTKFVPESWCKNPESLSWERVMVREKQESDHVHKDVSSVESSFSAGFSRGLWGGSASGKYKHDLEKVQSESKVEDFGLRFEVARVDILREWFNGGLLNYPTVYINGVQKGGICSGSLENAKNCSFALLPTSLILARNIDVFNNFSESEKKYINESTDWSAHAKVSYGPFSIGNDTSVKDASEDDQEDGFSSSGKITIGGKPQIIGIISTIMSPEFPKAEPSSNKNICKSEVTKASANGNDICKSEVTKASVVERMTTNALNKKIGL